MLLIFIYLVSWFGSASLYFFIANKIYYLIPLWLILGLLTSFLIIFIILISLMPFMKYSSDDAKIKRWLLKSASRFINFFLGIRIKVYGLENVPKDGNLTIYANHKSNTDPFLIGANFPRLIAFTPKISLYKIPIIANYMNYFNCLPIDRSDNRRTAQTMIKAIKHVENGLAMLIFPEAGILTRETDKILDIKGGAFKIGTKAKSDFLPVTIKNNHQIINNKWWKFWKFTKIEVHYHQVVKYDDVKELNTLELSDLVKEIINSKLDN